MSDSSIPFRQGVPGAAPAVLTAMEARLYRRAINEGWPIPDEEKPAILASLIETAKNGGERARVAAAQTLAVMSRINLQARQQDFEEGKAAAEAGDQRAADVVALSDEQLRAEVAGFLGGGVDQVHNTHDR